MGRPRIYQEEPCKQCFVKMTCNKKNYDTSLCKEEFEYKHFKAYKKYKGKVAFTKYIPISSKYDKYAIRFNRWFEDISEVVFDSEQLKFDNAYKKYLLDKFVIKK